MSTRPTRQILTKKGFVEDTKHHYNFWLYINGKKSFIHTMFSHGAKECGDSLLGEMAKQLHLSRKEFDDLIDCALGEESYLRIVKDRGALREGGQQRKGTFPARGRGGLLGGDSMNAQTENAALDLADDAPAAGFAIDSSDDPDFDQELFACDPVFNRAFQAELRRRVANVKAGKVVYHDLIEVED
jgi:hypothetical protein